MKRRPHHRFPTFKSKPDQWSVAELESVLELLDTLLRVHGVTKGLRDARTNARRLLQCHTDRMIRTNTYRPKEIQP